MNQEDEMVKMLALAGEHFSLTRSPCSLTFVSFVAIVAQLVEHRLVVPGVAGSNPVYRPICSFGLFSFGLFSFRRGSGCPRVTEALNLSYGEHGVRFWTSSARKSALLLSFFSFTGQLEMGPKDYHREIGKQFARKGIVFVTANYRLYPEVRFPAFRKSVACLRLGEEKAGLMAGTETIFFLMGHSAGAHSLSGRLDPVYLKAHGGSLNGWGVVSMSAPYEFDPARSFSIATFFLPPSIATPPCPLSKSDEQGPSFYSMHGRFDPLIRYELCENSGALKRAGGTAESKLRLARAFFPCSTDKLWHIWPKPLLACG